MVRTAIGLLAVILVLGAAGAARAQANAIMIGIDAVPEGNEATSLGAIQDCVSIAPGGTAEIDVYVRGVPGGDGEGLSAFGFNLGFDPAVIHATAVDSELMLAAGGQSGFLTFMDGDGNGGKPNDPLPATTGNLRMDVADLSATGEAGDGVLSRITLSAVAAGSSPITLSNVTLYEPAHLDAATPTVVTYEDVGIADGATVVVGGTCEGQSDPASVPTKIPAASPQSATATPGARASGGASATPGATPSRGASATPARGSGAATPAAAGAKEDDSGGGAWTALAALGAVGALVAFAAGAGVAISKRRRKENGA